MFVNQRAWGIAGKVGGSIINKWITYVSRQSSSTHAVPSTEEHRTVRDSRKFLIAFNEIISLREQSVNKKKEKGGNEKCMRDAKDQSTASTAACVDSLEKGKNKSKDIIDGWLRHQRSKPIDGCIQQYDDRRRGIIKHTRSIASCTGGHLAILYQRLPWINVEHCALWTNRNAKRVIPFLFIHCANERCVAVVVVVLLYV